MKLVELQNYAESNGIIVKYWKVDAKKACVIKFKRQFHILLNNHLIKNDTEERKVLAHELGHCRNDYLYYLSDYFNPLYQQNILKAERAASDEACMLLVSLEDLKTAIIENDTEYAAAESLDLDIITYREIVECYIRKGLL